MVKSYTLHKFVGLSAGLIILLLSVSGFFLNHERYNFLYTTSFSLVPHNLKQADIKLIQAYWIDPENTQHRIAASKRGVYESYDGGENFRQSNSLHALSLKSDTQGMYLATKDGIYIKQEGGWKPFALEGEYISALSLSKKNILAVIDKHQLVKIERKSAKVLQTSKIAIEISQLQEDISLSRFVRDLHYGRGLFDGDISLYMNDYGAIVLCLLVLSGYFVWWLIREKKHAYLSRRIIRWHASPITLLAIFPIVLLCITGIFLDHAKALREFMATTKISHTFLPPVYTSLAHDIWSVDYDGKVYRIGNRYGVYASKDLESWRMESQGFAYKMIRKGELLYVSGMGTVNKVYDGQWKELRESPHMFRDINIVDAKPEYFALHGADYTKLPVFEGTSLYSIILALHDGRFFARWWVWVNDYTAIALCILCLTGSMRYYRRTKK